jgi:hypothetical protein
VRDFWTKILHRLTARYPMPEAMQRENDHATECIYVALMSAHGQAALAYWVENILCKPAFVPGDRDRTLINEGKRIAIYEMIEICKRYEQKEPAKIVSEHVPV